MNRKEARELIMKYIFQMEAQKDFSEENAKQFLKDNNFKTQTAYASAVLGSVCKELEAIDGSINENSKGWPVARIAKTDLAILRLAAAEILYAEDIPKSVSINEAVELAKIYGDEKSSGFVNAVLKNIG